MGVHIRMLGAGMREVSTLLCMLEPLEVTQGRGSSEQNAEIPAPCESQGFQSPVSELLSAARVSLEPWGAVLLEPG